MHQDHELEVVKVIMANPTETFFDHPTMANSAPCTPHATENDENHRPQRDNFQLQAESVGQLLVGSCPGHFLLDNYWLAVVPTNFWLDNLYLAVVPAETVLDNLWLATESFGQLLVASCPEICFECTPTKKMRMY